MDLKEAVLERLMTSPLGRKIVEEQAAERAKQRKALAAELAKVDAEQRKAMPALQKAMADAEAKVKQAQEAVKAAEDVYRQAAAQKHATVYACDRRRARARAELFKLAPTEALEAFKQWCKDHYEEARNRALSFAVVMTNPRPPFYADEQREAREVEGANHAKVEARDAYLVALLDAGRQADELAMQPLSDGEIIQELEARRAALLQQERGVYA